MQEYNANVLILSCWHIRFSGLFIALLALTTTSPNLFEQSSASDPVRHLEKVGSESDFNELSRTLYAGRFKELPHVMFVIDRREGNRIYYVNSRLYRFHRDFVNASYLSLERGHAFDRNYQSDDRRFLLGTISFDAKLNHYSAEFWEGDRLTPELVGITFKKLSQSFFAPIHFKPNSIAQEEAARLDSSTRVISFIETSKAREYTPLNIGSSIGQLRIVDSLTPETVLDRNQIVVLRETPLHIVPVSGLVVANPSSPLSHINMLARSWNIPNAYVRDADVRLKELDGKYVKLEVREDDYEITPADVREVERRNREWIRRSALLTPAADLRYRGLTELRHQRAIDSTRFGAKSANLGEVMAAKLEGVSVPHGFTIPFYYYEEFIRLNRLEEAISSRLEQDRFVHDPVYRKQKLSEIRKSIQSGRHSPTFRTRVLAKVRREYSGIGLFVRSSTNAEDLPNFSGAGLYTTVPNVRSEADLFEAIKTVWASIWNFEAYEARESFGINHLAVYPAVLIQKGIDADSAGVLITKDPFNPQQKDTIYLNAKRGLGIKVVEGRRVPEQVIYRATTDSIQVLTRSEDDTMLTFDQRGGVKEVTVPPERSVLTDEMIRRLCRSALQIKKIFRGQDQDIEWLYLKGQLFVVQSRPFIDGR